MLSDTIKTVGASEGRCSGRGRRRLSQPARATISLRLGLVLATLTCLSHCTPSDSRPVPSASAAAEETPTHLALDRDVTRELEEALFRYGVGFNAGLKVSDGLQVSADIAFALYEANSGLLGFAGFERRDGAWQVADTIAGPWSEVPEPGSAFYVLFPVTVDGATAVGGRVDAETDVVISLDSKGRPIDSDTPRRGLVTLMATDGAQVRGLEGDETAFAYPFGVVTVPAAQRVPADARATTDSFMSSLKSVDWPSAAGFVSDAVSPDVFVALLHDLQGTAGLGDGGVRHDPGGFTYLVSNGRRTALQLLLRREGGDWKVWYYLYRSCVVRPGVCP